VDEYPPLGAVGVRRACDERGAAHRDAVSEPVRLSSSPNSVYAPAKENQ
jgi:hypothetical protein